jgi:hypothetical protein
MIYCVGIEALLMYNLCHSMQIELNLIFSSNHRFQPAFGGNAIQVRSPDPFPCNMEIIIYKILGEDHLFCSFTLVEILLNFGKVHLFIPTLV